MPFVEISSGRLEWVNPPPKKGSRMQFNSMPFVMRALRQTLTPEKEYHLSEIILLINESTAGKQLHPPFRGKNAQKLIERLVRNGKIIAGEGGYTLPPERI